MGLVDILLKIIPWFIEGVQNTADIVIKATPQFGTIGVFVTGLTMFLLLFMMEADD